MRHSRPSKIFQGSLFELWWFFCFSHGILSDRWVIISKFESQHKDSLGGGGSGPMSLVGETLEQRGTAAVWPATGGIPHPSPTVQGPPAAHPAPLPTPSPAALPLLLPHLTFPLSRADAQGRPPPPRAALFWPVPGWKTVPGKSPLHTPCGRCSVVRSSPDPWLGSQERRQGTNLALTHPPNILYTPFTDNCFLRAPPRLKESGAIDTRTFQPKSFLQGWAGQLAASFQCRG